MDPAQLLNPKAFAKEKAKKRAPNYGPQQTRKPQTTEGNNAAPMQATYDPRALLNPKAGGSNVPSAMAGTSRYGAYNRSATPNGNGETASPNMASMIERQYGILPRDAALHQKRKAANDESDEQQKDKRAVFGQFGGSGVMGEHMKAERQKLAANAGPLSATIDLTDDKDDDDDVIFIADSRPDDNAEVCLGHVRVKVNAYRVPSVSVSPYNKMNWAAAKLRMHRKQTGDTKITMLDKTGKDFALMDWPNASVIAPLMDGSPMSKVRFTAWLAERTRKPDEDVGQRLSEALDVFLVVKAPRKRVDGIGKILATRQLFLENTNFERTLEMVNPHMPTNFNKVSSGTAAAARTAQQVPQTTYVSRTVEEMRQEATSMIDDMVKHEDLPRKDIDDSVVITPLMNHQKQALWFMHGHEHWDNTQDSTTTSLWKQKMKPNGKQVWYHLITNREMAEQPPPVQGGILADMMGLGKTLSILALVAATREESSAFGEQEPPEDDAHAVRNVKGTLIVCPNSVLTNWQEQIGQHTRPSKLKVYLYHGNARTQDIDEFAKYDIVLTTYGTVGSDYSGSRGNNALGSIRWSRVVLDEAHQIRNATTKTFHGCFSLSAQRRWAVTGTPVQNRLEDLGALIKFIRVKPFDDATSWQQFIIAAFKNANVDVIQHLRLLVDSVTLRRTKKTIDLKGRVEKIELLDFSEDELRLYKFFSSQSNLKLKSMLRDSSAIRGKSYAHVLRSILRLRQLACHGKEMLSEEDLKETEGIDADNAIDLGDEPEADDKPIMTDKQAYDVLRMTTDNEMNKCIVCNASIQRKRTSTDDDDDDFSDEDEDKNKGGTDKGGNEVIGYITPCYHLLCPDDKKVFEKQIQPKMTMDNHYYCPYDDIYTRHGFFPLTNQGVEAHYNERSSRIKGKKAATWNAENYSGPHTKVKALLYHLEQSARETAQLPEDEPPIRSVVFTEWTSYLDLIEYALDKQGIGYVRLDGKMRLRARAQVLTAFKTDPSITVLLVSIQAGGQGLNFTAANKVYMMEPQFNPGVEAQAIDRVHRLGQTRDVEIVRFVMRESIEESVIKLQQKKLKLAEMSMDKKKTKEEEAKSKIEELRDLFK